MAADDVTAHAGEPEDDPARVHVPAGRVARIALRPGFLVGHLVVVALAVTTVLLGRWQWHVAHVRNGDIQNYAYAFQWWIFCVFGILMWVRIMRDKAAREMETGTAVPDEATRRQARVAQAEAAPSGYRAYVAPTAEQIGDDPADPLRSRYNADLARYRRQA